MNIKNEAILLCNNCDYMFETSIWTEINAGEDPKVDNDIFQDRINFFKCEICGNIGLALYPVKINAKETGEKGLVHC